MLYHLFDYLEKHYQLAGASLFGYITFRALLALIFSLLISLFFGNSIIRLLRSYQIGETVRDLGLEGQKEKEGTPTMGGIIIVLAILLPCLLLARLDNVYILLMLLATTWMAIIGFIDDYIKVFRKKKDGLKAKFKIVGQVGLGIIVGFTFLIHKDISVKVPIEEAQAKNYDIIEVLPKKENGQQDVYVKCNLTNLPLVKYNSFDYSAALRSIGLKSEIWVWLFFIPFVIFIVTAVSNGSNLTDGLDGLLTGVSGIIGGVLAVFAYVSSNAIFADYLNILYLPHTEELVIFTSCFLGACIGFLWYNAYPARVFMGDTGSLTIGGIIAALMIILRKELLIPLLCGVFLAETLSVVLQVSYFKYTKRKTGEGKRLILMSPLHHHYQKKGIHEAKIVSRFWIVGLLLAAMAIITLKIR